MNSVDFCYWLQGYFELSEATTLTANQVDLIIKHLNLVFKHEIDPIREGQTTTPKEVLDYVHSVKDNQLIRC